MKEHLTSLSVIRNFNEKSARIDDDAMEALSECCPNIEQLEIIYSRKFDETICSSLGNLSKLRMLDLSYCPV